MKILSPFPRRSAVQVMMPRYCGFIIARFDVVDGTIRKAAFIAPSATAKEAPKSGWQRRLVSFIAHSLEKKVSSGREKGQQALADVTASGYVFFDWVTKICSC